MVPAQQFPKPTNLPTFAQATGAGEQETRGSPPPSSGALEATLTNGDGTFFFFAADQSQQSVGRSRPPCVAPPSGWL